MAILDRFLNRDGSTSIVSDSFAVYGEIQTGGPDYQEDSTRWHPKTLSMKETSSRYGNATEQELRFDWRTLSFPEPIIGKSKQKFYADGLPRPAVVTYTWSVDALDEFDQRILAMAKRIK